MCAGVVGDAVVRFNVVNLTKPDSLFAMGMRPVLYSHRDAASKGLGWRRCGHGIDYRRCGSSDGAIEVTVRNILHAPNSASERHLSIKMARRYTTGSQHLGYKWFFDRGSTPKH